MDNAKDNTDLFKQESINSSYTKGDMITPDDLMFHYFNELNHKREDIAFETFKNRTDEKEQTEKILKQFLGEYLSSHIKDCKVLDFGTGEGDLATKKANLMKEKCKELLYAGIDQSKDFVNITRSKLTSNKIDNQLVVGDMFNNDELNQLPHKATTVLASQVAYYAPSIVNFTDSVISRFEKAAFIIVQTNTSFLHNITKKYSIGIQKVDIAKEINEALLEYREVIFKNVPYPANIEFPKIDLNSLHSIARDPYNEIKDPDKKIARDILEFVARNSMECLEYCGLLEEYINLIIEHLRKNNGNIRFWNNLALIAHTKDMSSERLQEFWQKLEEIKYINDYNPFEQAISVGDIDIAKFLLNSGFEITEESTDYTWIDIINLPYNLWMMYKSDNKNKVNLVFEKHKSHVSIAIEKSQNEMTTLLLVESQITARNKIITFANEKLVTYFSFSLWFGSPLISLKKAFIDGQPYHRFYCDMQRSVMLILGTYLYNKKGDIDLHLAIKKNNTIQVKDIIDKRGSFTDKDVTLEWKNALHLASDINPEFAKWILNSEQYDIDKADLYGLTALHYAAINGYSELFHILVSRNANLEVKVKNQLPVLSNFMQFLNLVEFAELCELYISLTWKTFLTNSIYKVSIFQKLFSQYSTLAITTPIIASILDRADPEVITLRNVFNITTLENVLHLSSKNNITDITKYLIKNHFTKLNTANYYGEYPIHFIAANNNHELLNFIIDLDSNLNLLAKYSPSTFEKIKFVFGIFPIQFPYTGIELRYIFPSGVIESLWKNDFNVLINHLRNFFQSHSHNYLYNQHLFDTNQYHIIAKNFLFFSFSSTIFFKFLYIDKIFDQFFSEDFGTPLHYAICHGNCKTIFQNPNIRSFINHKKLLCNKEELEQYKMLESILDNFPYFHINNILSTLKLENYLLSRQVEPRSFFFSNNKNIKSYNSDHEFETVKLLIEKGADPDIAIQIQLFPDNQFIYESWQYYLYNMPYINLLKVFTNLFDFLKYIFPHPKISIKPIDYIFDHQDSKTYKYLKQYTTMDRITTTDGRGYSSDVDVIEMKDYGMYKGGTGKDTFIIHKNFAGKEEGYKIIIKDYEAGEQIILDQSFGIVNVRDIQYEFRKVMNKSSIALLTKDGEEIVTLLHYASNNIELINIKSIFLLKESHSISWWSYFFGNKKIEVNDVQQTYNSLQNDVSFVIDEFVYNLDQNAAFVIGDFDCHNKKQVIDFSKILHIHNIENIALEEIENTSVLVKDYSTEKVLLILSGIDLYDLSAKCFVFV